MDWKLLLTAGTIAALVSAAVGLITTLLTLRLNRKKERHSFLFTDLMKLRTELYEIEPTYPEAEILERGYLTGPDCAAMLEYFRKGDDLYIKTYRPLFDTDLQQRIERARGPVVEWLTTGGMSVQTAQIRGIEPLMPNLEPIFGNVVGHVNLLRDSTDEQLKRIRL